MNRRVFITLLGGASLVSPLAVRAQNSSMPVIGFLLATPLIMSVYGVAEAAASIGRDQAIKRRGDPTVPYLLGEPTNQLTMVELATDDMVRLANDLDFTMSLDLTNASGLSACCRGAPGWLVGS